MRRELEQLREECEEAVEGRAVAEESLAAVHVALEEVGAELTAAREAYNESEQLLQEARAQGELLQQEVNDGKEELRRLFDQLKIKTIENGTLVEQIRELVSSHEQALESRERELEEVAKRHEVLVKQVEDAKHSGDDYVEVKRQADGATRQLADVAAQLATANEENETLRTSADHHTAQMHHWRSEAGRLESSVAQCQQQLSEAQSAVRYPASHTRSPRLRVSLHEQHTPTHGCCVTAREATELRIGR
jgi:chromosome segregation ATPase